MSKNYFNDNFLLIAAYAKKEKLWKKNRVQYQYHALVASQFLSDLGYSRLQMKRLLAIHFNHFSEREMEAILDANAQIYQLAELVPTPPYKPGDKVVVDPGVSGKEKWAPGMVTSGSGEQGKDYFQVILCHTGEILKAVEEDLKRISRFQTSNN